MKDKEDETEVRKLAQDVLVKLNQLDEATPSLLLNAITKAASGNVTYSLPKTPGFYTIFIPSAYLTAQTGGPYLLTLTTNLSARSVVTVPIGASTDTILSGDLLFDIYVDSSGNVISKDWTISGSNANGTYIKYMTGGMEQFNLTSPFASSTASGSLFFGTVSVTFPTVFIAIPAVSSTAQSNSLGLVWSGFSSTITASGFSLFKIADVNGDTGYCSWHAIGRWK